MSTTLEKFEAVTAGLKAQFVERDAVIDGLLACLVSGQHALLLGPPGTAKSALVNAVTSSIEGASYFGWLMTKASPPEEILGPVSLAGLEQDQYCRVTRGKLPEAHIAFLDEIFKCNSTVLNAMLSILNERIFYNDGAAVTVPLQMCVGASNEYPEGAELGALYDRFLGRWWVDDIADEDNFCTMLKSAEPVGLPGALTFGDVEQARNEVRQVRVSEDALRMLAGVRRSGQQAGVVASGRRWRQSLRYLRGVAWLGGETEVSEDTFGALADVLWREHKERPAVLQVIGRVANPAVIKATELLDAAKELVRESAQKEGEQNFAWSIRVGRNYQEIEKIMGRLRGLAEENPSKRAIATRYAEAAKLSTDLKVRTLRSAGMA